MNPRKSVVIGAAGFVLAAVTLSSYLVVHSVDRSVGAVTSHPARDPGLLSYVTTAGQVELLAVHADGSLTDRRIVGPVSASSQVTVRALAVSGDGRWIGWVETPKDQTKEAERVVVRSTDGSSPPLIGNVPNGVREIRLTGGRVVALAYETAQASPISSPLKFSPVTTPPTTRSVLNAISQGILVITSLPGNSPGITEQVTMIGPQGQAVAVHRFPRLPAYAVGLSRVNAVTFAGDQILMERGDHTDFCGNGPSSDSLLVDVRGGQTRSLGHPGTAAQQWRLEGATFAGRSLVAVWATCKGVGLTNDSTPLTVNTYISTPTGWRLLRLGAAIAAGGPNGALLAQPSRYVAIPDTGATDFSAVPTGDAVLINGAQQRTIALRGVDFAWVP